MGARVAVWVAPNPHAEVHIQDGLEILRRGVEDAVVVRGQPISQAVTHMQQILPSVEAVVFSPWFRPPVTSEFWRNGGRLRVIAGTFDFRLAGWIDVKALQTAGIEVVDTSRSMTPSVAEFALAMILNLIRDIPRGINLVRQGGWKDAPWDLPGYVHGDLTGRSVGLAGFGSISRRLVELLKPFRCQVRVYDPYVTDAVFAEYGVERMASLSTLAAASEIFVVGLPPTPTTVGIIDSSVIAALPPGALFALVTRMQVVEQRPLWDRIEAGTLRAAIDVFDPEPPPASFWGRYHPHVLPTPHIAGGANYCHRRCFTAACQDTLAILGGMAPTYPVTQWDHSCYQGTLTNAQR